MCRQLGSHSGAIASSKPASLLHPTPLPAKRSPAYSLKTIRPEAPDPRRIEGDGRAMPRDEPSSEYLSGPVGWWEVAKNLFERLGATDSHARLGAHIIEK